MIDVNKITSTLAKLPDAQLQQYAQMHKSDPYIMALAMTESNRRKELRAAGQGAQGVQEMPKVVDRAVAEMAPQQLPEEMGIGQLPAGNMNFAGGGIIAFADGGDVERYNGAQSSLTGVPYADVPAGLAAVGVPVAIYRQAADIAARMGTSVSSILGRMGYDVAKASAGAGKLAATGPGQVILAGGVPATQFATDTMANNPQLREAYADNHMMGAMDPNGALAAAILDQANPKQKQKAQETLSGTSTENNAAMAAKSSASPFVSPSPKSAEEAALLNRYPTSGTKAAPTADTGRKAPGAGLGTPAAASLPSLTDLAKLRQSIYDKQDFKDPASAQLKELEAKERASAEEGLAALKRDQAKFEDAFKGREARLIAREGDIGKQKDTNIGLAVLNAGLAIMSTPGGLATAIGKGAQVGTAQYAAGLDKIRSAQERLDDARDKMEELKLNRAEMSAKEIRAAEKDIRNTGIDAQKRAIDGIRMAADVNEKRATDIFGKSVDLSKTIYEQQQANARSAAGIAAQRDTPDRLVFDQLVRDNKGDAVKAAEALQKMKAEKFNMYEAYSKYLTGFAGKETVTPPQSFDQFASQFFVPTTKAPGKGATVLRQP
jgi:hypothetical protein